MNENLISIIIVAVLGVIGNVIYFEYRLRKEHKKEITKEQLMKLLLPLYIILNNDDLITLDQELDRYEHESDKPIRLLTSIKNILDKNLYLADDDLQRSALLFLSWAYSADCNERFQKLHSVGLDEEKDFTNFRDLVYKKYDKQKKRFLN